MYGLIVTREHSKDAHDAIKGNEIWFDKVGSFNQETFLQHCQAAAAVNLSILIVDLDTTDPASFIRGIRIFRQTRRDTRIILLAPGRKPGDPTITTLLPLQIYDIIAPDDIEEEEEEEHDQNEEDEGEYIEEDPHALSYLALLIKGQIDGPYGYGNIARWDTPLIDGVVSTNTQLQPIQEKEISKKKERLNVTDPALVEHIHSIQIEPPPDRRPPIKEIIVKERILGTVVITIAGAGSRTGTTHSAIRLAKFISSLSYSVACVELLDSTMNTPVFFTLETDSPTKMSMDFGFHHEGVDLYSDITLQEYIEIQSAGYQYLVVDMGKIISYQENRPSLGEYIQEFFRSDIALITTAAAVWDFGNLLSAIDGLWANGWKKPLNILVNLCDEMSFKNLSQVFKKSEKKELQINFVESSYQVDPFQVTEDMKEIYRDILQEYMPKEKRKKHFFPLFSGHKRS